MPIQFSNGTHKVRFGTSGKPSTQGTITFWQKVIVPNDFTSRNILFMERDASPYATIRIATTDVNSNLVGGFEAGYSALSPQPNETDWYMWALIWNGTGAASVKCYAWKLGDADGTYSYAESSNSTTGDIGSALWGLGDYGSEYRNAAYAYVKIWNVALTLGELQAERVQGTPVKTSGVNRYHRLLTTTDTTDYSGNSRTASITAASSSESEPVVWEPSATVQHWQYDWPHQLHARR